MINQNESFRVSLVSPPSRANSVRPPLGLMYLASSLREAVPGVQVDIVDLKSSSETDDIFEKIVDQIITRKPHLVGISCLSTDTNDVKKLANRLKKEDSNLFIVVGGIHPTLFPRYFFENSNDVDYIVVGEGEQTIVELVQSIRAKTNASNVNGIGFKRNGKFQLNQNRDPIIAMDQMAFPAFDLVDMDYYTRPSEWVIRGVPISGFFVFTGRGCPFSCRFCVNKNLSGRRVRFRSAVNVVDELEFLVDKYRIDGFFIYDDAFGLNQHRSIEICDEILKRRLRLVWGCQARVNIITEDMIRTMKEAGCIQLEFGVESGSQRVLDRLHKQIKIEEVKKVFKLCDKYGMRKLANFLINVPGETEEDLEATFNLAAQIGANINLFNITTLFPGSDLFYDFKHDIPEDDLTKFASQDNIEDFLAIIESKYKLSAHKIPLSHLLQTISRKFPTRGSLSLRWDPHYLSQILKLVSFIYNPNYLKTLLKSKKKREYLTFISRLVSRITDG